MTRAGGLAPAREVELERVEQGDRAALESLVDTYLAELATHREHPVGPVDARSYEYLPLYWEEAGRHPFFVVARPQRVGFVLVREVADAGTVQLSDFYIGPEARRCGHGRAALAALWRRFPGSWELQVHSGNAAGCAFWPRCIDEFASGPARVREVVEEDGRRLQYEFEIASR